MFIFSGLLGCTNQTRALDSPAISFIEESICPLGPVDLIYVKIRVYVLEYDCITFWHNVKVVIFFKGEAFLFHYCLVVVHLEFDILS